MAPVPPARSPLPPAAPTTVTAAHVAMRTDRHRLRRLSRFRHSRRDTPAYRCKAGDNNNGARQDVRQEFAAIHCSHGVCSLVRIISGELSRVVPLDRPHHADPCEFCQRCEGREFESITACHLPMFRHFAVHGCALFHQRNRYRAISDLTFASAWEHPSARRRFPLVRKRTREIIMRLATIGLATALALTSTLAFAQSGAGSAGAGLTPSVLGARRDRAAHS
jgi:hypothetical protein